MSEVELRTGDEPHMLNEMHGAMVGAGAQNQRRKFGSPAPWVSTCQN